MTNTQNIHGLAHLVSDKDGFPLKSVSNHESLRQSNFDYGVK